MKKIEQIIQEAIGQASMCWNPRPSSEVFNSDEAIKIAKETCQKISELALEVRGEKRKGRGMKTAKQCDENIGYNQKVDEITAAFKEAGVEI